MKYSFNRQELNSWKACITERLVERYVRDIVIPTLKKKGWDNTFFLKILPIHPTVLYTASVAGIQYTPRVSDDAPYLHSTKGNEMFFISNGVYPTNELLTKIEKPGLFGTLRNKREGVLENVPDGFLVKLKKTGKSKSLREALTDFGLERFDHWYVGWGPYLYGTFWRSEHDEGEVLPIVDGEVEIIEVKSGKSILLAYQRKSYLKAIKNGYLLRFFHVEIVSFKKNHFEVKEKLVRTEDEIRKLGTHKFFET